jgi:hypothetical protein
MKYIIVYRPTGYSNLNTTFDTNDVINILTGGTFAIDNALITGIKRMTVGEYTFIGNHTIIAVSGAVTTDALKTRGEQNP